MTDFFPVPLLDEIRYLKIGIDDVKALALTVGNPVFLTQSQGETGGKISRNPMFVKQILGVGIPAANGTVLAQESDSLFSQQLVGFQR